MTFLASCIDWFQGKKSSHMGSEQYVAHSGMRHGKATSGSLLWATAEKERYLAEGNMVSAEANLLRLVAQDIDYYVPREIAVIELGPGTPSAFRHKTLPIITKLESKVCVVVDESIDFLKQIASIHDIEKLWIKPVADNFFDTDRPYLEEQSLVCSFGSTISNIINPISPFVPKDSLVSSLSTLSRAAHHGWFLIGFDSDENGERIKNYFKKHALFQLNIFDRMAAELSIQGNFDPQAFLYEPEWIASSGQLAHIAIVTRDMNFKLGEVEISLRKDQKLHIKNSYKFAPAFFEECCRDARLEVIHAWADASPAKIYLLKILPRLGSVPLETPRKSA